MVTMTTNTVLALHRARRQEAEAARPERRRGRTAGPEDPAVRPRYALAR